MDVNDHIEALRREGDLLAATAERTSLDAPVPDCPGWSVRDLLRHLGGVHRWAAHVVRANRPTPPSADERRAVMRSWGDDGDLLPWFRDGHAGLLAALAAAPEDLNAFTFFAAPSSKTFWARRQAHETAIHRFDMQRAAGHVDPVDPALAIDGVDELLAGFLGRREPPAGPALAVTETGTGRSWTMRVGTERVGYAPDAPDAGCAVSGPATTLYPLLWNRSAGAPVTVHGDTALFDRWPELARI